MEIGPHIITSMSARKPSPIQRNPWLIPSPERPFPLWEARQEEPALQSSLSFPSEKEFLHSGSKAAHCPTLADSQKVKQGIAINESDSKNGYAGGHKTKQKRGSHKFILLIRGPKEGKFQKHCSRLVRVRQKEFRNLCIPGPEKLRHSWPG